MDAGHEKKGSSIKAATEGWGVGGDEEEGKCWGIGAKTGGKLTKEGVHKKTKRSSRNGQLASEGRTFRATRRKIRGMEPLVGSQKGAS